MLFNHPQNATAKDNDKVKQIAFCRDCEADKTCTHEFSKVHPVAMYVYRYLIDMENGFKIYPHKGTWEDEPDWFITLLTAATNELHSIQAEANKPKGKR